MMDLHPITSYFVNVLFKFDDDYIKLAWLLKRDELILIGTLFN